LKKKEVTLHLNDGVKAFSSDGSEVYLNTGHTIASDLNIMAVGIQPSTALAEDADLTIGETGGIKVNDYMQTSDEDIYALGDAAETKDWVTGTAVNVALAPPAHKQAYIIARHLSHQEERYKGTLGTSIIKIFDLTVGATGHNSAALKQQNISFKAAEISGNSHAGYYPGAEKLWIKILFDDHSGKLYGAQVIGFDGVDKRLAVLATAIQAGLRAADLETLELGYAPPYSGPKDLINVLGYKAAAKLEQDS
jgi:NADPH-dependent 2,4-dienoyl-CoA reductase/sulfur reductase-like enzyme